MTSIDALNRSLARSRQALRDDLDRISRGGLAATDEWGRPCLRRIADIGACTWPSLDLACAVIRAGHPRVVEALGPRWQGYLGKNGVRPGSKIFAAAARGPVGHLRTAMALGLVPALVRRGVLIAALREDDPVKLAALQDIFGDELVEDREIAALIVRPAPSCTAIVATLLRTSSFDPAALSELQAALQDSAAISGDVEARRIAAILYRLDPHLLERACTGRSQCPGVDRLLGDMRSNHGRLRLERSLPGIEELLSGTVPPD